MKKYFIKQKKKLLWRQYSNKQVSGKPGVVQYGNQYNIEWADYWGYRTTHSDAWSLQQVKTLSGAEIRWQYEDNKFDRANGQVVETDGSGLPVVREEGGPRVQQVLVSDGVADELTWSYFYTDEPGVFVEQPKANGEPNCSGHATALPNPYLAQTDTRPLRTRGGLYTSTTVQYEMVQVVRDYQPGATNPAPHGYVVYEFYTSEEHPNGGKYGDFDLSWRRGQLRCQTAHNAEGEPISKLQNIHCFDAQDPNVRIVKGHQIVREVGWPRLVKSITTLDGVSRTTEFRYAPEIPAAPDQVPKENTKVVLDNALGVPSLYVTSDPEIPWYLEPVRVAYGTFNMFGKKCFLVVMTTAEVHDVYEDYPPYSNPPYSKQYMNFQVYYDFEPVPGYIHAQSRTIGNWTPFWQEGTPWGTGVNYPIALLGEDDMIAVIYGLKQYNICLSVDDDGKISHEKGGTDSCLNSFVRQGVISTELKEDVSDLVAYQYKTDGVTIYQLNPIDALVELDAADEQYKFSDRDGQPNLTIQYAADGTTPYRVSKPLQAYWYYPGMADKHMLTQTCGTEIRNSTDVVDETVVTASATTWDAGSGAWRPRSSYVWKWAMNEDGTAAEDFDGFNYGTPPPGDNTEGWIRQSYHEIQDKYGHVVDLSTRAGASGYLRTATIYGLKNSLPVATLQGIPFDNCAVFTCDYDDNAADPNADFDEYNGWIKGDRFTSPAGICALATGTAHFGEQTVHAKNSYGPTKNVDAVVADASPDHVFSAWVCPLPGASDKVRMAVGIHKADGSQIGSCDKVVDNLNVDAWQYIEHRFSAAEIKSKIGTHPLSDVGYFRIWLGNLPSDGQVGVADFFVDDIRFYRSNALVTTTYYDSRFGLPMCRVDANNNPGRRITYDGFGRPEKWHKIDVKHHRPGGDALVMEKAYHLMGDLFFDDFEGVQKTIVVDATSEYEYGAGYNSARSAELHVGTSNYGHIEVPSSVAADMPGKSGLASWKYKAAEGSTWDVFFYYLDGQGLHYKAVGSIAGTGEWDDALAHFDLSDVSGVQRAFFSMSSATDQDLLYIDNFGVSGYAQISSTQ
ncbi:MAG: hypothetical protein GF410_16465 [Chitinivibrionales bacterium]|nr:hypothetical protein [Chitinivibrionales bacterium]